MNGDAMIELRGVVKDFGRRRAVEDLSLAVPRGEIYGLLGHNGAGKSTAIGMMLGQVWPTAGAVIIRGHEVTHNRAAALARVGAIFEAPVFYDYLSGWRNLEVLSHYSGPVSARRLAEVLDWVRLTGREHSKVRTYSHGMRARLAIAQALLPDPELLILDEPSDGLDPEGIHEMRETILRLRRDLNLTILLSSHLLNEVEQLCTRIAVMNRGRKVFEGTIADATRRPNRIRLLTDDFAAAARALTAAGLADAAEGPSHLTLRAGIRVADVARWLVENHHPIHELAAEEQTLEQFYLSLMNESRAGAQPTPPLAH